MMQALLLAALAGLAAWQGISGVPQHGATASDTDPVAVAPQSAAASFLREGDYRVARIGYRLGLAGARLCPEPYPLTGLLLHHLAEYEKRDQPAATAEYGLGRGPGVLAVVEDSPAARAGLAAGDVVTAVNGQAFARPDQVAAHADAAERRLAIEASEALLERELRKGPARLSVLRTGEERQVALAPVRGCPARFRLAVSGEYNAYANRGYVIMTTALLGFTQGDDELAIVLGHELAHVILKHPEQLAAQGVPGHGLLRGIGKNRARVRATEFAADRLGLELAWTAGYDLAAAAPYRRRFSAEHGSAPPKFLSTHPTLSEREQVILDTIARLGGSKRGAQRP